MQDNELPQQWGSLMQSAVVMLYRLSGYVLTSDLLVLYEPLDSFGLFNGVVPAAGASAGCKRLVCKATFFFLLGNWN